MLLILGCGILLERNGILLSARLVLLSFMQRNSLLGRRLHGVVQLAISTQLGLMMTHYYLSGRLGVLSDGIVGASVQL